MLFCLYKPHVQIYIDIKPATPRKNYNFFVTDNTKFKSEFAIRSFTLLIYTDYQILLLLPYCLWDKTVIDF